MVNDLLSNAISFLLVLVSRLPDRQLSLESWPFPRQLSALQHSPHKLAEWFPWLPQPEQCLCRSSIVTTTPTDSLLPGWPSLANNSAFPGLIPTGLQLPLDGRKTLGTACPVFRFRSYYGQMTSLGNFYRVSHSRASGDCIV